MSGERAFLSLNKRSDWEKGQRYNVQVVDEGMRLDEAERFGFARNLPLDSWNGVQSPSALADLTLGESGVAYLLDDDQQVWVFDEHSELVEWQFGVGAGAPRFAEGMSTAITEEAGGTVLFEETTPGERVESSDWVVATGLALAYGGDVLYVVGQPSKGKDSSQAAVSAYVRTNGQVMWELREVDGVQLMPLAVATDREQYLYVLSSAGEKNSLRVVQISPHGQVLRSDEVDAFEDSQARLISDESWTSGRRQAAVTAEGMLASSEWAGGDLDFPAIHQRFWLAVSEEQDVYVLDSSTKTVLQIDTDGVLRATLHLETDAELSGFAVDGDGTLYVGDRRAATDTGEEERYLLQFAPDGSFVGQVSGYRGQTDKLLLQGAELFAWNRDEKRITVLERHPRTQVDGGGTMAGVYLSHALDSGTTETIWHKIVLDMDLPDETEVRVYSYASDRKEVWLNGRIENFDDFVKSDALALADKLQATNELWSGPLLNPKDALLRAQGRYLWLRLDFVGNEKQSPWLQKVQVYFPRTSYLQDLPGVYQEDPVSRDFLERFLSLFGTFLEEAEGRIRTISRYFDPDAVSGPFLEWLGSWLGIAPEEGWSEAQMRALIQRAPQMYKRRGTRRGLMERIEWLTGEAPIILEYFQYKRLLDNEELRGLTARLNGLDPYGFAVLVREECVPTDRHRLLLQKVLAEETPAFAEARLVILERWMRLGTHSYVEMNTYLSEPDLLQVQDGAAVPTHTLVIDEGLDNRLELHTRLELDSELE